uniref:Uncharacterized protein n=1 Tax=Anguilla anguilla TaxID=7936 RepID=A0A0E9WGE9_ANGAN
MCGITRNYFGRYPGVRNERIFYELSKTIWPLSLRDISMRKTNGKVVHLFNI